MNNESSLNTPLPILPQDAGRPIWMVYLLIILTIFSLGIWSVTAPLSSGAIAQGQLAVASSRKTIQHLEGGIVEKIFIHESQKVKKGQTLIQLDATQARSNVNLLQKRYLETKALESRLLAERIAADEIQFPDVLSQSDSGLVRQILQGQKELFDVRRQALIGQAKILVQRTKQLERQIEGFKAQKNAKERQLSLINDERAGINKLFKKGLSSRTRLLALQRNAQELKGQHGQISAEIARAEVAIGETQVKLLQIRREFLEKVETQLHATRTELTDLSERLTVAEDILKRTEIKAPMAGKIVGLSMHTKGGIIQPGSALMDIVPQEDHLVIDALINPMDIDTVKVGLTADIMLTAFSRNQRPVLTGTIKRVSPDVFTDGQSGRTYYKAQVVIGHAQLAELKDIELIPGMPANVMIKTGERTAIEYLIGPLFDHVSQAFFRE
ncbi:HlyD family type I secretion periplasmic adaptor subunit [Magnetococcales bacterium HHB-1]